MTHKAGKVNVANMARAILGIPLNVKVPEMNDEERKNFHSVCGVFRGKTNGYHCAGMGGYKTGKGMKLIERFVYTH